MEPGGGELHTRFLPLRATTVAHHSFFFLVGILFPTASVLHHAAGLCGRLGFCHGGSHGVRVGDRGNGPTGQTSGQETAGNDLGYFGLF